LTDPRYEPLISIVVLNYNKSADLARNLSALREIPYSHREIIVVDNRSTDDSVAMVRRDFADDVELIVAESNGGVCRGRNLGFRRARGEYVVYLDDDAVAPPEVCDQVARLFEEHPTAGCLAFLVREMPEGRVCNDYGVERLGNYHGAGHAFRKECLEKIGYLDEHFFFGAEEIDSSLALMEEGYYVRYTPEITVDHYVRRHGSREFARRASNWMASMGWFYVKWFPWRYAIVLSARQFAVMAAGAIRRFAPTAGPRGICLFLAGLPGILRTRRVASERVIAFYLSDGVRPKHFIEPLFQKLTTRLTRSFSRT
jgi:GT2 family glycosyltransferase